MNNMKMIDPVSIPRDDGGADFRIDTCESICYSVSKEGMGFNKCRYCRIRVGWVETEIYCNKQ